jgi:ligand-binding sensor domain-containing protein
MLPIYPSMCSFLRGGQHHTALVLLFVLSVIPICFYVRYFKHPFLSLLFVLSLFSGFHGVAQYQKSEFSYFTTSDGLSQSWVTAMTQDTLGFLWIGTEIGLNRFDGDRFKIHTYDPADTTSIRDNSIWSLLCDRKGRLWIGTTVGLERYDFERDIFIHYIDRSHTQRARDIKGILEDREGNVWIATSEGLGRVDPDRHFYSIEYFPRGPAANVTSILEDNQGVFWMSTRNSGVFRFDRSRNEFESFDLQYETKPDPRGPEMQLSQVYQDSAGELWIACDAGLLRFDNRGRLSSRYVHNATDKNTVGDNRIHFLAEDADNNLWIAHSNGASVLNKTRDTFFHHTFSPDNPSGLNNNFVTCIFKDNTDNLWLGTRNSGLNVLFATGNNFKLFRHQPNDLTSLSNNIVKAVLRDKDGGTWFGTDGGGLNYLSPEGKFSIYRHDSSDPRSLPNDLILSLFEDSEERIWVGTFGGALSVMDKKGSGKFEHFFADPDDQSKLRSAAVSVIYEDSNYNFWIGTWYGGLHQLDRKKKTFTRFPYGVSDDSGITNEKVIDIFEARSGEIFIATGHGLNVYNPETKRFTKYLHSDKSSVSISGNVCNSVCEDAEGQIWIGTEKGLNLFDRKAGTFRKFGIKEGLPDETIQGILLDAEGNLWISTLKGICRFNPDKQVFRNYGVEDGLQGSEFITHSYCKGEDGVQIFGGNVGANLIDLRLMKPNHHIPPIVFTELKVLNKTVKPGKNNEITREIAHMDELVLTHELAFFTLEFAALSFANAKANQYAYRLEPIDKDWNYISGQRSVMYNGLGPGIYKFTVKGSNNDGVWNEKGATILIRILPPWWRTWWARLLAALLFIATGIAFYKRRLRQVKIQNARLEKVVDERTRELHHVNEELLAREDEIHTQNEALIRQREELIAQNRALVESKKQQLDLYTQSIIEKTEVIERISGELESLQNRSSVEEEQIQKFNAILHSNILTEGDWERFKKTFEDVYPNFFASVRFRFPEITSAELRLSALIKLNLSNKEAANMLGISTESVKKSRYRLKKRFELEEENSLEDFVKNLV